LFRIFLPKVHFNPLDSKIWPVLKKFTDLTIIYG
jgi:hypothetical protein